MTTSNEGRQAYFLGLREIAGWQLKSPVDAAPCKVVRLEKEEYKEITAELPALQRGAVWNAAQTEAMWDSLVRGFPIGAFFLAPYQKGFGRGKAKFGDGSREQSDFLLLDGQQRATAITLGFLDHWPEFTSPNVELDDMPALWVDMAEDKLGERSYVFRVLTRSHPWGYRSGDPKKRLANSDIRAAMACFRMISGNAKNSAELPLRCAWPWDATCPIPVAILLAIVGHDDWRGELKRRLALMPLRNTKAELSDKGNLFDRWEKALDSSQQDQTAKRLTQLVELLKVQLSMARIPALILPIDKDIDIDSDGKLSVIRKDAVETLFVRVNSAGTPIVGEELIYSSLKASWPDAPDLLEKFQQGSQQLVTPARLVSLLWRLHLAFPNDGSLNKLLPASPAVGEFRKAIRDNQKREAFEVFVKDSKNQTLFKGVLAWARLKPAETQANEAVDWRLPPTLASQLFSGEKGLDILFIVAAWFKRLQNQNLPSIPLTDVQSRQSLGFIVAISWFAERPNECVSRLWAQLQDCSDQSVTDFFNRDRFSSMLLLDGSGRTVMLPLAPPELLERLVSSAVDINAKSDEKYWAHGSSWSHFTSRLAPEHFSNLNKELGEWLKKLIIVKSAPSTDGSDSNSEVADMDAENEVRLRLMWYRILDKMWAHRPLVDYAQREWLLKWFPTFDPTLPGQMEDVNRPWDYDHIHPASHIVNKVPSVIREWHQSIGNLRAWPLELNRGDQDDSPESKLGSFEDVLSYFKGMQPEDLRTASFIDEWEWQQLKMSVPSNPVDKHYLSDPKSADQRNALLCATTSRFCRLYRHWYVELEIGSLSF